jgi:hypothetical protein
MVEPRRWIARAYARANGFYWAPCPVCGEYSGGHESPRGHVRLPDTDENQTVSTCPDCAPHYPPHFSWKTTPVVREHPRHTEWRKEQGI